MTETQRHNADYLAGCRDAKAKSMEENVNDIYELLFTGKDCMTIRVSNLELWMKVLGVVFTIIISPLIVLLVAKVFFGV
jgi:hypothetical protein